MADTTSAVATTIARWRRHERLKAAQVARAGGISADAVLRIETGRTAHPQPATLERITVGLATDPWAGALDDELVERIAEDLRRAADSGEATGPAPGCHGPSRRCWTREGGFCTKAAARAAARAAEAPQDRVAETLLELGLYHALRDKPRARAWDETIRRLAALRPDEVRALGDRAAPGSAEALSCSR